MQSPSGPVVRVQVPATSANLGPGFDVLGLAIDIHATVTFTPIERGVRFTGCDRAYCNASNLAYQAYALVMTHLGLPLDGVWVDLRSDIPVARGLGSSAALILAGVLGANALAGSPLDQDACLALAIKLEPHPDNLAAALLGGLVLSGLDNGRVFAHPFPVHPDLGFLACIPPREVSTEKARQALPERLSYADAAFNMAHLALALKAFETGDAALIKTAFRDRLHQPYRAHLIPEFDRLQTCVEHHPGCALVISGSGSTMLALCSDRNQMESLRTDLGLECPDLDYRQLRVDRQGARLQASGLTRPE